MKYIRALYRFFFPKKPCCLIGKGSKLYPQARISNTQQKESLISIGRSTHVLGELLTFAHGGQIKVGNECYIGEGSRVWSAGIVHIGDRVLISHNVNIIDNQTHSLSASKRNEHFRTIFSTGHPSQINLGERPIVIEDDVWIACQSIILRGVRIGKGAVIGAGSVVTKDVPAWTVAQGNPAKFVREIQESER